MLDTIPIQKKLYITRDYKMMTSARIPSEKNESVSTPLWVSREIARLGVIAPLVSAMFIIPDKILQSAQTIPTGKTPVSAVTSIFTLSFARALGNTYKASTKVVIPKTGLATQREHIDGFEKDSFEKKEVAKQEDSMRTAKSSSMSRITSVSAGLGLAETV